MLSSSLARAAAVVLLSGAALAVPVAAIASPAAPSPSTNGVPTAPLVEPTPTPSSSGDSWTWQ
ncbi:hypothetical protein [Streptomyces sp. NPDC006879]|uniref:hypothetical protein n=1 Tax=Streptomyces sp. NPDC006879 TaxID=3364767 RepID=UPI0036AAC8BB